VARPTTITTTSNSARELAPRNMAAEAREQLGPLRHTAEAVEENPWEPSFIRDFTDFLARMTGKKSRHFHSVCPH
jgi:hypothetical protein